MLVLTLESSISAQDIIENTKLIDQIVEENKFNIDFLMEKDPRIL